MSSSLLFLILAALTAVGYLGGRWRAASAAQGDARRLHSRTTYHGLAVGMGAVENKRPRERRFRQREGLAGAVGVEEQQRGIQAAARLRERPPERQGALLRFVPGTVRHGRAVAVEPRDVGEARPQLRAAVQVHRGP